MRTFTATETKSTLARYPQETIDYMVKLYKDGVKIQEIRDACKERNLLNKHGKLADTGEISKIAYMYGCKPRIHRGLMNEADKKPRKRYIDDTPTPLVFKNHKGETNARLCEIAEILGSEHIRADLKLTIIKSLVTA